MPGEGPRTLGWTWLSHFMRSLCLARTQKLRLVRDCVGHNSRGLVRGARDNETGPSSIEHQIVRGEKRRGKPEGCGMRWGGPRR